MVIEKRMLTRRTLCLAMVSFHSRANLKHSLLRKGHGNPWCSICDRNQPKECQERTNARSNNNSTPESRCNKQNKRRTPASLKIQYLKRYIIIGWRGKKSRNLNRARSTPLTSPSFLLSLLQLFLLPREYTFLKWKDFTLITQRIQRFFPYTYYIF